MNISLRQMLSVILVSLFGASTVLNTAANPAPLTQDDAGTGAIVNTTNGNAHWVDTVYPGSGPMVLDATFHYNSRNTFYQSSAGDMGHGWSHGYSSSIVHFRSGAAGPAIVEFATMFRADGKRYDFEPDVDAWVGKGQRHRVRSCTITSTSVAFIV